MIKLKLSALLPLLIATQLAVYSQFTLAAGEVYKWTDDDGITNYTALPPLNRPSEKVRSAAGPSYDDSSESDDATPNNDSATEDDDQVATEAAIKPDPERCAQAQSNLKTLTEKARIRVKDGADYRYLTPEEITEQTRINRQIIEDCQST